MGDGGGLVGSQFGGDWEQQVCWHSSVAEGQHALLLQWTSEGEHVFLLRGERLQHFQIHAEYKTNAHVLVSFPVLIPQLS